MLKWSTLNYKSHTVGHPVLLRTRFSTFLGRITKARILTEDTLKSIVMNFLINATLWTKVWEIVSIKAVTNFWLEELIIQQNIYHTILELDAWDIFQRKYISTNYIFYDLKSKKNDCCWGFSLYFGNSLAIQAVLQKNYIRYISYHTTEFFPSFAGFLEFSTICRNKAFARSGRSLFLRWLFLLLRLFTFLSAFHRCIWTTVTVLIQYSFVLYCS